MVVEKNLETLQNGLKHEEEKRFFLVPNYDPQFFLIYKFKINIVDHKTQMRQGTYFQGVKNAGKQIQNTPVS